MLKNMQITAMAIKKISIPTIVMVQAQPIAVNKRILIKL